MGEVKWYGHVSRSSVWPKPSSRHNERGKNARQTEMEVKREHQGMDRPRVHQVPEGSGDHRKMEEGGCEVICGAPTNRKATG